MHHTLVIVNQHNVLHKVGNWFKVKTTFSKWVFVSELLGCQANKEDIKSRFVSPKKTNDSMERARNAQKNPTDSGDGREERERPHRTLEWAVIFYWFPRTYVSKALGDTGYSIGLSSHFWRMKAMKRIVRRVYKLFWSFGSLLTLFLGNDQKWIVSRFHYHTI